MVVAAPAWGRPDKRVGRLEGQELGGLPVLPLCYSLAERADSACKPRGNEMHAVFLPTCSHTHIICHHPQFHQPTPTLLSL